VIPETNQKKKNLKKQEANVGKGGKGDISFFPFGSLAWFYSCLTFQNRELPVDTVSFGPFFIFSYFLLAFLNKVSLYNSGWL
jgi:hypothetical protein